MNVGIERGATRERYTRSLVTIERTRTQFIFDLSLSPVVTLCLLFSLLPAINVKSLAEEEEEEAAAAAVYYTQYYHL